MKRCHAAAAAIVSLALCLLSLCLSAHAQKETLRILKVDPPNWFTSLPAPMLLVKGEGLQGATASFSDPAISVTHTHISDNGHWMFLWLAASPSEPEDVTLRIERGNERAEQRYTFAAKSASPEGFSSRDVIYLLMPDRFADGNHDNDGPHALSSQGSLETKAEREKPRGWHGGDLRGVTQHLDYLQQLGVTSIWMTPVDENLGAESYHGYHATDMYAVDPHFGTMDDLKALSAALHARNMKLVLDTVPNHMGPLHPWVTDEPEPDWFHGTAAHHLDGETNFRALIDPHAVDSARLGTLNGWFANSLPDMNTELPEVEAYLRQNAQWWIEEAGADALRIDTFPYIPRSFWGAYLGELTASYPRLTEVGEAADHDPVIVSSFAGGETRAGTDTKLYTPFDFPTFFAMRDALLGGASLKKIADVIADDALYPHPERLVVFFDNHDNPRFLEGGRALSTMKLAYAFVMTMRGTPQLYYGDEIGMRGGEDPDNRRDFPGGFAADAQNVFTAEGRTKEQQEMFLWSTRLGKLRSNHIALQCGGEQTLAAQDDWLVYLRDTSHRPDSSCHADGKDERVLIAIHRGEKSPELDVSMKGSWMEGCSPQSPELSGSSSSVHIANDILHLHMDGEDVLVVSCR